MLGCAWCEQPYRLQDDVGIGLQISAATTGSPLDVPQRPSRYVRPLENAMADDKTKSGGQDRTRIDTDQEYEVRDWAKRFGVSAGR